MNLSLTKTFAFLVTDFNEDDYICENDLKRVIQRLCGEQRLSDENVNALIQKVIIVNYTYFNFAKG